MNERTALEQDWHRCGCDRLHSVQLLEMDQPQQFAAKHNRHQENCERKTDYFPRAFGLYQRAYPRKSLNRIGKNPRKAG